MMKTYTIVGGKLQKGIRPKRDEKGLHVGLGEPGRGRTFVRVPWKAETLHEDGWCYELPGKGGGAVLLIADQSGFRGSWLWTGPAPLATGHCAQGIAGRMGGGPEILVRLAPGESGVIARSGRLYGDPAVLRVVCDEEGGVTLRYVESEKAERMAEAAIGALMEE